MQKTPVAQSLDKGLVTDTAKTNQPPNTYSYALNAVNETKEGDLLYRSNEKGNTPCSSFILPGYAQTFYPIGHVNFLNNDVLLFLATADSSQSAIAIYTGNCNALEVVLVEPCLNFNINHQIKAVYRLRKGCNRTVYFVDGYNPDRVIDIDEIINDPLTNRYIDENGNFDCTRIKLSPDALIPEIDLVSVNDSGGNLKYGVYEFAVALGDEDLNFTSWLTVTNPVPIGAGLLNGPFNLIEGGNPLLTTTTSKSISIQVGNLDTRFVFAKLAVIQTIASVTTAYEIDTFSIPSNGTPITTLDYTFAGIDVNSATVIPLTEIATARVVYDRSKTVEQQDQRLIRGNVKEKNVDYATFQRAANLITTRYVTKPIKYETMSSVQSGDFYFDNRSYLRDEIYALGIKAIWADGSETAIAHIPGRALDTDSNGGTLPQVADPSVLALEHNRKFPTNGWDSSTYTVVNADIMFGSPTGPTEVSIEDARAINKNVGDEVKRWEVFNTAYRDELNTLTDPFYSKGQLAYWESSYDYPNTTDCSSTRIYPTGKIRHHKMPDTTLEPHHINDGTDDYILPLGLEFNLQAFIAYLQANMDPQAYAQIEGFKIVRAKRDRGNKTVIDKGLAYTNVFANDSISGNTYCWQTNLFNRHGRVVRQTEGLTSLPPNPLYNTVTNIGELPPRHNFDTVPPDFGMGLKYDYESLALHSPKTKFDVGSVTGAYIKMEKEMWGKYENWGSSATWGFNEKSRASWRCQYKNYESSGQYKGTPKPDFTNRLIENKYSIGVHENLGTIPRPTINRQQLECYNLFLSDNIPYILTDTASYGGSPEDKINSFHGAPLANDYATGYYISVKEYKPGVYNQLHNLIYHEISQDVLPITTTTVEQFGGDTFISLMSFRKTFLDSTYADEQEWAAWQNLVDYFAESEINCKLRHRLSLDDSDLENTYYPYHGYTIAQIEDMIFNNDFQKVSAPNTDNAALITCYEDGKMAKTAFNYNKDYSKELVEKPCFPLPIGYDYCSDCLNTYPHRIVFSQKSYQEETFDHYLTVLANNYRDMSGHTGEIIDLFRVSDMLYIRTEYSLWELQTKPQELRTNAGNIYVATGEFFEIPPRELASSKLGYGGGQTRWDLVVTEFGALFADQISGMIFQFNNRQLSELSRLGNRKWFAQNLPSTIKSLYPEFPHTDNPASAIGTGLLGYYDPVNRRYILTKKDYKPLNKTRVTWNNSQNSWSYLLNPGSPIPLYETISNPYERVDVFENKSWTISYSLNDESWVSWHSYLPNYAFYTKDNFYTSIVSENRLYQHNTGDYQEFYETVYPYIFEYVVNQSPAQTKTFDTTSYISNTLLYDANYDEFIDVSNKTFDKAIFYNDVQTSGELDVVVKDVNNPFSSLTYDPSEIQVSHVESTWNFNGMRDMVQQTTPPQPLFDKTWGAIASQYPIDKIPNVNIVNYLKSQFEMERFRDGYMAVRLKLSDPQNHKVTVKYILTKTKDSIR